MRNVDQEQGVIKLELLKRAGKLTNKGCDQAYCASDTEKTNLQT
jgi:hypothetical protein